jgi:transposase
MTMDYYAGIDVSLEASSVCVVDATGKIVKEAKVLSEPEDLIAWFKALPFALARIGLEAGPLSQWLYAGLKEAGFAVELLETRHVRDAFKSMPVKTDRKDARGIAQLMRLGWFKPVHCKSVSAQETRALLTARKLVQGKGDARVRLSMTAPGVGAVVGLTYVAAIDDPGRFSSSKTAGAHFGMTPKRYQSGETDVTGRISKAGDKGVRTVLYEAAHVILTTPVKGGALKSWAARLAKRAGLKKAAVALARKLAVILHRMLADGVPFDAAKAAA